MSSVKLSHRKEVKRCDKNPDPTRKRNRMEENIVIEGNILKDHGSYDLQNQGLAKDDNKLPFLRNRRDSFRDGKAVDQRRDREDKSC